MGVSSFSRGWGTTIVLTTKDIKQSIKSKNIFCPFSTISPILKFSRAFKIEGNLFASENIEIK